MDTPLFAPSDPKYAQALAIVRRLRETGHEALIVGGAVRNVLLGVPPKDFDIATSARPDAVASLFPHCLMVGAKFGVVLVVEDDVQTEVATFRSDGAYLDHRRPVEVHYSTPEKDARRRDFTMNALFYDPLSPKVIDHVGGLADIESRRLRAIGDPAARFEEDALRLLRAVRFACRFSLDFDPATRAAIVVKADLLSAISPERIREELSAILTGPDPGGALEDLQALGLLQVALPEVAALKGVPQPPEYHPEGDVFTHLIACFKAADMPLAETLAFGLLFHDIGKPTTFEQADRIRFNGHAEAGARMADEACRRLRFSNDSRERVVRLVADHMRFMDVTNMRRSTLRRFMAKPGFDEDLELHRLDCLGSHRQLDNHRYCMEKREELLRESREIAPPPLVRGDDLVALGLKPGPRFGEILREIYDRQLEDPAFDREAGMRMARELTGFQ